MSFTKTLFIAALACMSLSASNPQRLIKTLFNLTPDERLSYSNARTTLAGAGGGGAGSAAAPEGDTETIEFTPNGPESLRFENFITYEPPILEPNEDLRDFLLTANKEIKAEPLFVVLDLSSCRSIDIIPFLVKIKAQLIEKKIEPIVIAGPLESAKNLTNFTKKSGFTSVFFLSTHAAHATTIPETFTLFLASEKLTNFCGTHPKIGRFLQTELDIEALETRLPHLEEQVERMLKLVKKTPDSNSKLAEYTVGLEEDQKELSDAQNTLIQLRLKLAQSRRWR